MRQTSLASLMTAISIFCLTHSAMAQEEMDFTQWHQAVDFDVTPSVPPLTLPLTAEQLQNTGPVLSDLTVSPDDLARLQSNAFVRFDYGQVDDIVAFYEMVESREWPVFVTSDALLHLYHIQFDETLRGIEERAFMSDLAALVTALRTNIADQMERTRATEEWWAEMLLAAQYLQVAEKLLAGDFIAEGPVGEELMFIQQHGGFQTSTLFNYTEDYSQYVPRGHYTRSPALENYFRAMMWLGRMAFLIKGNDSNAGITDALVDDETAGTQTGAAHVIANQLNDVTLPDGRRAMDVWDRIYRVTAFYVGAADDLTPRDYLAAQAQIPDFLDDMLHHNRRRQLASMRSPEIYAGIGRQSSPTAGEEEALRTLAATAGMRFMGQRFVPDSHILGQLVFPNVGTFNTLWGGPMPFTGASTAAGVVRAFPRGLDVMSVFGFDRAELHLSMAGDASYESYGTHVNQLRQRYDSLSDEEWNRNLYWSWLHGLRALDGPWALGYPSFMQSEAWRDRMLETALASWTALRHDTILYAKQSYTAVAMAAPPIGEPPPPPRIVGYVEPVPVLYARLLALARMKRMGLTGLAVLDAAATHRLERLEQLLERLLDISIRELENTALTDDDYEFIKHFSDSLEDVVAEVESEGFQTTLVADVHTDSNTEMVLEEASGPLQTMLVAYQNPEGQLLIGVGPTLSYYEFKQPIHERLTDEAWRARVAAGDLPMRPEWAE